MRSNKEKLHAIGNYLKERFGYEWSFQDASSSKPSIIYIEDIDVTIRFSEIDDTLLVSAKCKEDTVATRLQSPMQVINYIITRKYEVR